MGSINENIYDDIMENSNKVMKGIPEAGLNSNFNELWPEIIKNDG